MDQDLIRTSESPARTIDSHDSTTESIQTIVDRNKNNNNNNQTNNIQQLLDDQTKTMANSTNSTNNCNKNSLTNSQISMITSDNNNQNENHHIYTNPDLVYTQQKSLQQPTINTLQEMIINPAEKLMETTQIVRPSSVISRITAINSDDIERYDIKKSKVKKKSKIPICIFLGLIQLILSIALTALGWLLIIRDASLASSASGLWSGGICAMAGILGVINLSKTKTGFLAMSLICVASSTLAMALTGIGLVRDINRLEVIELNHRSIKAAILAGGGLVFTLVLHFIISIISVYQSAQRLCSRYNKKVEDNVIASHNTIMNQQKVEEYIKSMSSLLGSRCNKIMTTTDENRKLKIMNLYAFNRGTIPLMKASIPHISRPVILVPATAGISPVLQTGSRLPPPPPPHPTHSPASLYSSGLYSPNYIMMPPQGPISSPGFISAYPPITMIAGSLPLPRSIYNPESIYKLHTIHSEIDKKYFKRRNDKNDPKRRLRRKSESDMECHEAFIYTGLDRAIADSFLQRQQLTQSANSNHSDNLLSSNIATDNNKYDNVVV